ncbi:MAG: 2-oxoglutarate dehydrogenase, E2 component, dihydrolipoamide succinyltransferase [Pseudonocardiaceae bacterium]|nr:2-oxoglutarate dehydrogenase, E2 component, dihydrolipoamide succinyltransferase [Pseudonocardiaceae bacterium]
MAYSVEMPALGESVTEGTVTRWLKQEGESVAVDEPLLEVSTDKVDTEIPSPAGGVLQRIVAAEDETVEVGAQLALIGDEVGETSDQPDDGAGAEGASAQQQQQEPAAEPPSAAAQQPQVQESPGQESPAQASGDSGSSGGSGTTVSMPALGESVTEGTVTRWLKQVGDTVAVDEPLLEVSTDKVDTEIPSPVAGTVLAITVSEDETVEVGAALAVVGSGSDGETSAEPTQLAQPAAQSTEPTDQPAPALELQPADGARHAAADGAQPAPPYVTPLVRKLAAQHGVDLGMLRGSGVGGRIRKQDVLAAVEQPEQPAAAAAAAPAQRPQQPPAASSALRGRTEKMSRLRSVIANRMVESLQTSAQLTTVAEVDVSRIARLRSRAARDFEAGEGVRLSFLAFFAKATIEALKQHPKVNASIDEDAGKITYHGAEHLGIAVDTERGLLVPVIHDAGDLNIAGLARRISDVAERTRTNKITPDELGGGTFTLSNTGSRGALFDTPIILQPQVGILGTGSVVKRPVVVSDEDGDTIAVRSMMYLALSYDHRLVDGADAARFLTTVKDRLEEGAFEADLGL